VTKKRNGPLDERPAPRTVETVSDDLNAHDTRQSFIWHAADRFENHARSKLNWPVGGLLLAPIAPQPRATASNLKSRLPIANAIYRLYPASQARHSAQGISHDKMWLQLRADRSYLSTTAIELSPTYRILGMALCNLTEHRRSALNVLMIGVVSTTNLAVGGVNAASSDHLEVYSGDLDE
jgi:hypothetical protein